MSEEINKLDIKEFRELGFLQEANRQFFHPLGLALEVVIDEETGEESLGEVWDYRGDPGGMLFGEGRIDQEKIDYVRDLYLSKAPVRSSGYGSIIQEK